RKVLLAGGQRLAGLRVELDHALLKAVLLHLEALLGGDDLGDALLDVLQQLELLVVAVVQRLAGILRAVEQLGDLRLDDGGEPSTDAGHLASWVLGSKPNATRSLPPQRPLAAPCAAHAWP